MLARFVFKKSIMSCSALERIIANNKIAEETLEVLKREVSPLNHLKFDGKSFNQKYALFAKFSVFFN